MTPTRFNGHPPLGVNATPTLIACVNFYEDSREFQWAPTLGGECYLQADLMGLRESVQVGFNGHPPLGVNATNTMTIRELAKRLKKFQWAPTLGGECYLKTPTVYRHQLRWQFQWAPTLGGECYQERLFTSRQHLKRPSFNGHPPLGVNATPWRRGGARCWARAIMFQWAPTLGGECYR